MPVKLPDRDAACRIRRIVAAGACDLHLHTTASDGTTSPGDLVRMVVASGLRAFSVTDHDTVAALPGIRDALSGLRAHPLADEPAHPLADEPADVPEFVPGVELSADFEVWPGHIVEIHLLGYFPLGGIEAVEGWLGEQRARRTERNQRMCAILTELGMPLSMEELEAEGTLDQEGGNVVGRVQAANILVRKGFAESRRDAFQRFLNPGRPGYARRDRPDLRESIGFLVLHGGVPVVAHPHVYHWTGDASGLGGRKLADVLVRLRDWGLAGVEAFHGEASEQARAEVRAAGLEAGLLLTAGSDFHGSNKHAAMYDRHAFFEM